MTSIWLTGIVERLITSIFVEEILAFILTK